MRVDQYVLRFRKRSLRVDGHAGTVKFGAQEGSLKAKLHIRQRICDFGFWHWGQNAKLHIRQRICDFGFWHWGQNAKLHIRQRICKCGAYQVANSRPFRA
jgi:hypothetical protein